jgi:hypothetical protein
MSKKMMQKMKRTDDSGGVNVRGRESMRTQSPYRRARMDHNKALKLHNKTNDFKPL